MIHAEPLTFPPEKRIIQTIGAGMTRPGKPDGKEKTEVKKACILCEDSEFSRLLYLLLSPYFEHVDTNPENTSGYDFYTVDCDMLRIPDAGHAPVFFFAYSPRPVPFGEFHLRPFPAHELTSAAEAARNRSLFLPAVSVGEKGTETRKRHTVFLGGTAVMLSDAEYRLLMSLAAAGGAPVPRDELEKRVFPGAQPGVLNVYIHYLRKKLESDGVRRIFSRRNGGYALRSTVPLTCKEEDPC